MRLKRESKADFRGGIIGYAHDECGYSVTHDSGVAACSGAIDVRCTQPELGHREALVIYGTSLVEKFTASALFDR
jgi:hypothetical protein